MIYSKCLNCTDRFLGCHSTCYKYLEYRSKLDKIKENKLKDKQKRLKTKRGH